MINRLDSSRSSGIYARQNFIYGRYFARAFLFIFSHSKEREASKLVYMINEK